MLRIALIPLAEEVCVSTELMNGFVFQHELLCYPKAAFLIANLVRVAYGPRFAASIALQRKQLY